MSDSVDTQFFVSGMKCDGCIAKARGALEDVPGYQASEFDLKEGVATINGNVDPQAVIQALSGVGYGAVVKSA